MLLTQNSGSSMEKQHTLGLLRIRVCRGVNLAVRDVKSSDPYVIIALGKQRVKTRVVKKNLNPEWNEDLTLYITDQNMRLPIKLAVYDRDTFSWDDKMGDAEFDIQPLLEAVKMGLHDLPNGIIIKRLLPNRQNCLAEESCVRWVEGTVVQNLFLRLRNVECGEVELKIQWINARVSTAT